jgi:subtilisin family serine protease
MQSKSNSKLIMIAALTIVVCGMASPALADSSLQPCTNRTLKGNYGFTIEGILGIPGSQLPPGLGLTLRGVAMTHYDGRGNFTQMDHVVIAFAPASEDWTPGSGTYTVNPDCTGTAVLNSAENPVALALHFVIVKEGKEIRQVVDANAVTAIGEKVED